MKDPTASLRIQYLDMIRILRNFLRAERLGNWYLHLEAVSEMLPYLASSGHSLYAKSASIYLSFMANLPSDHPEVHQHFVEGLHVARRSDRAWAGLSTDLMIEHVLMCSMKTSGGLTRGRGMTEQQRLTWLLAMPACAEVNRATQELSGAKYSTNEQNKETGKSRQRRDMKDTHTLLLKMSERNPFAETTSLRNIMTGVNATGDVDVCRAKEIGQKIMDSVTGIPVAQYTVKRSDQVTTLQSKSSVRVAGRPIHVDPELLFQRLIVASNAIDDRRAIFRFELCSYPSALVDDTLMPRAPQKAVLANAIWTRLPPDIAGPTEDVEGCLPFERRKQTELHRHVELLTTCSLPCWMPHRTRGGGCRPVDCANSNAIGSYEEHCPRGRRYRSGHPAMLLCRWLRLVHAVFNTGDNEEEPNLGYQSHPK